MYKLLVILLTVSVIEKSIIVMAGVFKFRQGFNKIPVALNYRRRNDFFIFPAQLISFRICQEIRFINPLIKCGNKNIFLGIFDKIPTLPDYLLAIFLRHEKSCLGFLILIKCYAVKIIIHQF